MKCTICGVSTREVFRAVILGSHEGIYDYCVECGFLGVRDPHWLEEAYSDVISITDTGYATRNYEIAKELTGVLYWLLKERGHGRYVDVAGGYGILTRIMRDYGFDFYWHDKYCNNLFARGFELQSTPGRFSAVTAIEVLEHLQDPVGFIRESLLLAKCNTFIFTTVLFSGEPSAPEKWWYYSCETGQHIAFFQRRTLKAIAEKLQMNLASAGRLHVLSARPLNEFLLRICASPFSSIMPKIARWQLGSRTMKDHEIMVEKLKAIRKD